MSFYGFVKRLGHAVLHLCYRVEVVGLENFASLKGRGKVLCCNHVSMVDPVVIFAELEGKINFLGKIELFKNRFLAWFFKKLAVIPVNRGKGSAGAIKRAVELVSAGGTLCIFPEGTRSKTGKLLPAKSGAALITFMAKADLLPMGVRYEKRCLKKLKFRHKVVLYCGPVISWEEFGFASGAPGELKVASKLIMSRISELLYGENQANVAQCGEVPNPES